MVHARKSIMPERRKSGHRAGVQFLVFLRETERANNIKKSELKEIYNTEFKARNQETKVPNFSKVFYFMKLENKVYTRKDEVHFLSVQGIMVDQWHRPRRQKPQKVNQMVVSHAPAPDQRLRSAMEENMNNARSLKEMLKKDRSELISDKKGITITADKEFEDGSIWWDVETEQFDVNLKVENTGTHTVDFMYYAPLNKLSCFTLNDKQKVTRRKPLSLKPGDTYPITVNYHQLKYAGHYPVTLTFEFKQNSTLFYIVRDIHLHFMNKLGKELEPIAPFKRSCHAAMVQLECCVVEGVRPDGHSSMELKNAVRLYSYEMPKDLGQRIKALMRNPPIDKSQVLTGPLRFKNYSKRFHELLYMEEEQMQLNIRRYFIPNSDNEYAIMERDPANSKLLILKVPGLSENRPSVLRGDKLLVYPQGETKHKYCGYVHKVERDSVKLGFSSKLLNIFIDGMKFNVEFTLNRLILRLEHRAVDLATQFGLEEVLFPPASLASKETSNVPQLSFFNRQLAENPEQMQAVRHIVAGTSKPAPYLVFGPPGTGKTITLVEAIKQIDKLESDCHILACAPSNSAVDVLCSRILKDHGNKSKVYRMFASNRDPQSVSEDIKAYSNLVGDGFIFPSKEKLMTYRIIVTTLITAGRLVTGNLPNGHFTHIFVDEAGQATEPDCLIPLAGLLDPKSGLVVLAGDHKQLGPIVASPLAEKYGMGISFLERMMDITTVYQKEDGAFNDLFVTQLLHNYRSHEAILAVPNELFYEGKLEARGEEMKINSLCKWEHLVKQDFPVIFHGVTGINEREASSPSFFNRAEIQVLMDYVEKLLQTGGKNGLAPKDIGIIAPYRKQVQKIHQALNKIQKKFRFSDMSALKVGSVEEFQGQERRVILVSTVRSSLDYTDFDKCFNLGFVGNEKRFNVAMTRAQALLIVVGNPTVLSTEDSWKRFIIYCQKAGAYLGYKPVEDDEAVVDRYSSLYQRMRAQAEGEQHDRLEGDVDELHFRAEE
ncbi:putative helicase mov-10-B.1 [Corythoichthys intestinalis]|uniref:putative helicase mov-10-B.1 n=1 Tax=Corythoichthys intestinalis TaxID=161448 RepID=UPI0025A58717|nr:putative helicase mov-10-B.1 [Corythoichthys intestinalis]